MKRLGKGLMIFAISIIVATFFFGCVEVKITDNSFDSSFILSGNVEKAVKYMPVSELGLSAERIELSDVIGSVTASGKIEKLLILTRGSKSIVINSECIPFYYLSVNSSGLVRLQTTLEAHNQTGIFPILSLSEIVVISDEGTGIECVFNGKSVHVNYLTFMRTNGMLLSGGDATENDVFNLSLFSYRNVSVKNILGENQTALLHFEDGASFLVSKESTPLINWSMGGIRLVGGSEEDVPKTHVVRIEFQSAEE